MSHRTVRIAVALVAGVALLSCSGADGISPMTPTPSSDPALISGPFASGPVAGGSISVDRARASRSAVDNADVSWGSDRASSALVLRDTTGRAASAIIGIDFSVPGVGPMPAWVMTRPIGSTPLTVFHEHHGDFELAVPASTTPVTAPAIAHVTLRIPGPSAMTIDVPGAIVPGSYPTTYTWGPYNETDALSCG
jgi:hypothetical protein